MYFFLGLFNDSIQNGEFEFYSPHDFWLKIKAKTNYSVLYCKYLSISALCLLYDLDAILKE